MDTSNRWGRNSPIHMATADNGPSQLAIGSKPSLNNFANGNDYNYDGLVVNKSQAGQFEYVHQKWPHQNSIAADMVSFKGPMGVQVPEKRVKKKEVLLDEEDKLMENAHSPLVQENCPIIRPRAWPQPTFYNGQPTCYKGQPIQKQADCVHVVLDKQEPIIDLKQPPIDRRPLKKREVLPSESKDTVYQKQPQKRCAEDQFKEDIFEGLSTISLRETDKEVNELIESINLKHQKEPKCMIFDQKKFSAPENLVDENNSKNSGSFGEVTKVVDSKTRSNLIRKKIKDKVDPNEVKVPIQFMHKPNLCAIYGFFYDGSDAFIVQEDAGMSIRQLGSNPQFRLALDRPEVTEKIVFGIFQGLAVLDSQSIVHCDIKPENVCIKLNTDNSYTAKLIDFGSCKTQTDKMTYTGLTPEYLPPNINEFLHNAMHKKPITSHPRLTGKDDVWGAGMVTLYLKKGEHPIIKYFLGQPEYPRDQQMTARRFEVMRQTGELRNPLPDYFKTNVPVLDEMLNHVLVVDAGLRWSSSEVVSFFKAKLNPEPELKRHKQDAVLCQPRFVQQEHKLIKRDNSTEDVDLKVSKGVYQPHLPASPNAPVEDTFEGTFGGAFRLKQEGQNPNTMMTERNPLTQSVFQTKVEPSWYQSPHVTQDHQPTYLSQQLMQAQRSRKVEMPVQGLWGKVEPMDQEEADYDELVQSFICPSDRPNISQPQYQIGNIPNMNALLDDDNDGRIKIKGRRRSRRE